MRQKYLLAVFLVFTLIFSLSACGSSKDSSTAEVSSISAADQQAAVDKLAADAEKIPEPDTKAAAATNANGDDLLGNWSDVADASRGLTISKTGDVFQYKDNDGTYTGTVKDGVLTIKISDAENDTAMVFIDPKTKNLVTNYQGDIYEYSKKIE
jgi:hypothetical protein